MIVIKIELWPSGDESKRKELCRGSIVNDWTGTNEEANYNISLLGSGDTDFDGPVEMSATLNYFKRKKYELWDLVAQAMIMAIGEKRMDGWERNKR